MGRGFAITYFQTLLDSLSESGTPTRNDSGEDGLQLVDVDALIRKGRATQGLGSDNGR